MSNSFLNNNITSILIALKEDKVFMDNLSKTADKICNYRLLILNEFWDNVLNKDDNRIHWNCDLNSGFYFPAVHYSQVRKKIKSGVDIKNCWELSRMQYLFAPSLMYRITGDEKYVLFVKKILCDWAENNLWEEGPNWSPAMETGIRIANILLAFQLIMHSKVVDDDFCSSILTMAHLHYKFIIQNEENIGGRTSNHYLGGLIGLLSIATSFPFFPYSKKTILYVRNSLEKEIQMQILEDGGGFEGSSAYQQLIGEIFSLACILIKDSEINFSNKYYERLSKAVEYASSLVKPDNTFPQIGDNDGGHIFRLMPTVNPDNSFFISLCSAILLRKMSQIYYCKETGIFCDIIPFLKNEDFSGIHLFPKSHQVIYRDDSFYIHFSAINANVHNWGHMHNDKLSFELSYLGKNFITDSGSGVYTPYPEIRNTLRSITSHSTVQVAESEQNSFCKRILFGMNHDSDVMSFSVTNNANDVTFSGVIKHNTEPIYMHKRIIYFNSQKPCMKISDTFQDISNCKIVWRLALHPDVQIYVKKNVATLENNGVSIKMRAFGEIKVSEGLYSSNYGKWEKTKIVEIKNMMTQSKIEYSCTFDFCNEKK
jgi:hypothetical protein